MKEKIYTQQLHPSDYSLKVKAFRGQKERSDLVLHFLFKKFVKIQPKYGPFRSKTSN